MGMPKLTLSVSGMPMLDQVLRTLRESRVDRTVVVLGADDAEVRERVRFGDELVLDNRQYRKGMSSSLKLGVASCRDDAEAVLIVLGDQPFLSPKTVDAIVEAYYRTKAPIVIPVYRGQRGNPVLFDRSLFDQILAIEGDVGAKSVVRRNGALVRELPVRDRGVLLDVDTPADYESATRRLRDSTRMRSRGRAGRSRGSPRRSA
jgi:molybdenum cofactor cytidylyltransferase